MVLTQHYNDLTEIHGIRAYGPAISAVEAIKKMEGQIKTRIAFTDVKAATYPESAKAMDECGWKVAKKTLDWHDWHSGDSELRLYYKIFPNNVSDPNDKRGRGPCTYPCHQSLSGSCSMGLVNGLDHTKWLISKYNPHKYLTLIRLDRNRTQKEIAEMQYYRYKLVFKSDVARYFANGWLPDEWPGKAKEQAWWETVEAPMKAGFVYQE